MATNDDEPGYRDIPCEHCGRRRVNNAACGPEYDGVCEKCAWDNDRHEQLEESGAPHRKVG